MQVKFPSHLLQPRLCAAFTNWSHLSQQCFEVYLHCDWLPGALFSSSLSLSLLLLFIPSHLCSLLHFFWISLTLLTFSLSPHLSSYPFLHFFSIPLFTLFFYLFFCLWAENWPKWMRSWGAVNTVIIWLLLALLTAEDALSMATLCFVISGENWNINLLEIRTGW